MVNLKGKIKGKIKRVMKPRELAIRKEKEGLSKREIAEVMQVIKSARQKGDLPALTYEYSTSWWFGKEPIYIRPKTADLRRTAVKIRLILRKSFGSKYIVYLL